MIRRQSKSVEIADGAVTAEKANFADLGAVVATLGTCTITSALNFADGVVVTGAIGLNAVTDVGAAVRESNLVIASLDTWEDVCSFTVSVAAGAAIILAAQATANRSHRWETNKSFDVAGDSEYRVTRNGSVVFEGFRDVYVDTTAGSGARTYKLQVRCAKPAAGTYEQAVWNWDTASLCLRHHPLQRHHPEDDAQDRLRASRRPKLQEVSLCPSPMRRRTRGSAACATASTPARSPMC